LCLSFAFNEAKLIKRKRSILRQKKRNAFAKNQKQIKKHIQKLPKINRISPIYLNLLPKICLKFKKNIYKNSNFLLKFFRNLFLRCLFTKNPSSISEEERSTYMAFSCTFSTSRRRRRLWSSFHIMDPMLLIYMVYNFLQKMK